MVGGQIANRLEGTQYLVAVLDRFSIDTDNALIRDRVQEVLRFELRDRCAGKGYEPGNYNRDGKQQRDDGENAPWRAARATVRPSNEEERSRDNRC